MELREAIEKRQSIRKYKEQEISNEDINKVLDAARLAPSGKNIQNWFFVAIKNKEKIEKVVEIIAAKNKAIADKMKEIDDQKAERFVKFCKNFTLYVKDAPVLFLVFAKEYVPTGYNEMSLYMEDEKAIKEFLNKANPGMQSIGAAVENMALMATGLGYGTCWLTSANYASAEIESYAREELGLNDPNYFFAGMMPMGVPLDVEHKSPGRKELEDISVIVE